jgi:thiol:disulfide interchange protein|tara:strand:+ start:664 stop:1059 length:396 start_codon:yes stop_codon:yes gene_type:complete
MKRRIFLATVAATVAPIVAMASDYVTYIDGVIETALAEGKTVFVDYSASWCSTCHRQERVINALRAQDPAYDAAMTFVKVDWDDYGDHEVAVFRNVPRRSTLIVLRGDAELGRVVAGTSEAQIKELMDTGL